MGMPTSATGQKRRFDHRPVISAARQSGRPRTEGIPTRLGPLWERLEDADYIAAKQQAYSITSSARSRIDVERSTPIAFAVLRLTANSNLVACSTGRSAGFAPLSILAT